MTILPARLIAVAALALAASGCATSPTEVRGEFVADGLPRVDVTIALPSEHRRDADRSRYAAFTTLRILGAWLTPFPDATLSVTAERTPWWTAPASMAPEYAVARAVSRRYWARVVDTRALPTWFVEGLAEYSARRAVSKIADEQYRSVFRSRVEGRYFGGFVPRDLRVPLRVEDEGDPVGTGAESARALLALGTLQRWTGAPVFDAMLAEFVSASAGTAPTLDDFARVASRVSGQDLSWFVASVLERPGTFDYALEHFDSAAQADGTFLTTLTLQRRGDAIFGRGIPVVTTFADGEQVRESWDGRVAEQTYAYRSPARAVAAEVDPDRMLLLDVNRGNNGMTLDARAAETAANRWSARWMIWLEDALLTYVAFT